MTTVVDTRALRHWLNHADRPHLVVCCVEHPDASAWSRTVARPAASGNSGGRRPPLAVVQLGACLADVGEAVLLELIAGGASGLTVALDGCANPGDAEALATRSGAFLCALGRPESIDVSMTMPNGRKHGAPWPVHGENALPVSRRALFGRPDGLDLTEPDKHPTARLVAILRELVDPDGTGTELDGIPTGVPLLTASRCAGSGACTRACPEDALTLTRTVLAEANPDQDAIAQFRLTYDPVRCTSCGQCLQACPELALENSGEYLWSSLLTDGEVSLRIGLIRRCARCGTGHGQPGDLCAVCAFRAANPFGSALPPGALGNTATAMSFPGELRSSG